MIDHTKYIKQLDIIRKICVILKENELLMAEITEAGFERVFIGAQIIDGEETISAHKDIYQVFRWK